MSWSYSGDPCSSPKDEVRFLLQDVDINNQLIQDAEIEYLLKKNPTPLAAAVQGARSIASKYTRFADEKTGDIQVRLGEIAKNYLALADSLKEQLSETDVDVFFGGVSHADTDSRKEDKDRVDGEFGIGFQDNYRASYDEEDRRLRDR